jgi:hypothetical protein
MVSLVARLDRRLAATARCISDPAIAGTASCPADLDLLIPLQMALAATTLLLLWLTAWVVAGSEAVAWTALLVAAFGCFEYAGFAHLALTESLTCLTFAGFSLCLLLAVQRRSWAAAAGAGVLLGIVSLSRPGYIYLAYALAALVILGTALASFPRRRHLRPFIALGVLASASCAAVVVPWFVRNGIVVGTWNLTSGYGGFSLAQRVAYDPMTAKEFVVALIYWLPDFGHSLAKQLFSSESYRRLGWTESADTYYMIGNAVIAPATLAAAGSRAAQAGYIIRTMILPDLPKFAAVTLVLAWRGLWFGKYFSIVCFPLFAGVLAVQMRRRIFALAVLSAPAIFMLFFQAAVSVSTARYNVNLIVPFSIAAAIALTALAERAGIRRERTLWRPSYRHR